MATRFFIGNLSWNVRDEDLAELGAPHGEVTDAKVITDRDTGRSRGFGFLTIETDNPQAVIQALDGQEVDGRAIRVNEAENKPRDRGGYGGGGRGGYGGGGGRDRY